MNQTVVIGDVLTKSKDLFIAHFKDLLIPAALAWGAGVLAEIFVPIEDDPEVFFSAFPEFIGAFLLVLIIQIVASMLLVMMSLRAIRGQEVSLASAIPATDRIVAYVVTSILVGLLIGFGFGFFIIPGIIFVLLFAFAAYLAIDGKAGIFESFGKSMKMTKGIRWQLLGLFAIIVVLTLIANIIPYGVGMLVSLPFTILMISTVYNMRLPLLSGAQPAPAESSSQPETNSDAGSQTPTPSTPEGGQQ